MGNVSASGSTKKDIQEANDQAIQDRFDTYRLAFETALVNQGLSGGGGGSTQTWPDLVISGTGPYVVPAGFNAIVHVTCKGNDVFTINGFEALGSAANKLTHVNIISIANNTVSHTVPTNQFGTLYLGYGGSGGNIGQADVLINDLRMVNYSDNGIIVSNPTVAWQKQILHRQELPVAGGDNLKITRINGSVTGYITGTYGPKGLDSSDSHTFMIPTESLNPPNVPPFPQTVFDGGTSRVIELYAI